MEGKQQKTEAKVEENPEFALLWEIALQTQSSRWFLIAGASATFSDHLKGKLENLKPAWIRCQERPFPVESNVVEVPDEESRYRAANDMVKSLLDRGFTILVFFPGKTEIANARESLIKAGCSEEALVSFHSELDDASLQEDHTLHERRLHMSHQTVAFAV